MGKKTSRITKTIAYDRIGDKQILDIVEAARKGIEYAAFEKIADQLIFSFQEWSYFLNISFRTLQRYKAENKAFIQPQSERILQIALLNKRGAEVFGDDKKFHTWLATENLALGNIEPKTLLDSAFGIDLLMDELIRIEHGVLA